MSSWRRLSEVRDCLTGPDSVVVSVYVQPHPMAPSLSRASRRILLKTGVWSIVVIVLVFFMIYTILLLSFGQPFHKARSKEDTILGMSGTRPKVRFLGRGVVSEDGGGPLLFPAHQQREGKIVWDPGLLDAPASQAAKCQPGSLFVIIITTSPDHSQHRAAIRKTWCNAETMSNLDRQWHCLFLIGQTSDAKTNDQIQSESVKFGDVVRGSYIDSYHNLTHKVMHGLSWVSRNCPSQFVVKTDDDCFVNTLLIRQFLLHHNTKDTNLYAGNLLMNKGRRRVIREPSQKWFVPQDNYLPEYYPVYASGMGYIMSPDVVSRAVRESRQVKPIANEDAYVGIVMDSLGVTPTFSGRFSLSSAGLRTCNYMYVFLTHGVDPGMQEELLRKAAAAPTECRDEALTDWF